MIVAPPILHTVVIEVAGNCVPDKRYETPDAIKANSISIFFLDS